MNYLLTGFKHDKDVRVFAFQCVSDGNSPATQYSVRADLSAARKHGISQQDLPILCRNLLTQRQPEADACVTFTEDELQAIADEKARNRAANVRKSPAFTAKQRSTPWRAPEAIPAAV